MTKLLELDPSEVSVREGLDRYRQDLGALADLANSIKTFGQLQPIVITKDNELVAGGRRLAACMMAGIKVLAFHQGEIDDITLREMEVEENIQRKAFSPAEEVLAIDDLHKLKQQIHGVAQQGVKGGWTLEHTAAAIGKTKGTVIEAQKLAEAVRAFPSLANAKDKKEIKTALKQIEDTLARGAATKKVEAAKAAGDMSFNLKNQDAVEFMSSLEDSSIDLVLTDPPYGIEFFKQSGYSKGGLLTYADDTEKALQLYEVLALEAFRFTKSNAHLLAFCSLDHFHKLRELFKTAGWDVHVKPFVWVKQNARACNWPSRYPTNSYEVCLFARKEASVIVKQGYHDWLNFDAVVDNTRVHPTQKPIPMLRELISRFCLPGSKIADPFAGSGSVLLASLEENCIPCGSELDPAIYNAACSHYEGWKKRREKK